MVRQGEGPAHYMLITAVTLLLPRRHYNVCLPYNLASSTSFWLLWRRFSVSAKARLYFSWGEVELCNKMCKRALLILK